jgi:hypothetical protein
MSNTLEVGKKLVELCSKGKNMEAVEKLYDPKIVSIEAHGDEKMPARMEGIGAIKEKHEWWFANNEVHPGAQVHGPFPHGDRFIVYYTSEITPKAGPMAGQRIKLQECGLYTVKNGKVVHEEFFYDMGG